MLPKSKILHFWKKYGQCYRQLNIPRNIDTILAHSFGIMLFFEILTRLYLIKQTSTLLTFMQLSMCKLFPKWWNRVSKFSDQHVIKSGFVSTHSLNKCINTFFQITEHGVPAEELVGSASPVHKGNKKSLSAPQILENNGMCAFWTKKADGGLWPCLPNNEATQTTLSTQSKRDLDWQNW